MSSLPFVQNLSELLKNHITSNEKLVNTDVSTFTAPGENYGSTMLRLSLTINDAATNDQRILELVAKCVPDSKKIREVFTTSVTFYNELKFYEVIVPTLDKFLKSKGMNEGADFAAPFYGGQWNLENGNTIDNDGVIILANLKALGYITPAKKTIGMDAASIKVTLDSLAKFHAAGLGLRLQQPQVFEQNLTPYFFTFRPSFILDMVFKNLISTLERGGFTKKEIETVTQIFWQDCKKKNIKNAWGTMIHYDTWTNNILVKYKDSTPVHSILVDFQVMDYGTALNDVMFFLFTSVEQNIFETELDDLLNYYYNAFLRNLSKIGVDTSAYTKESFDEEVKFAAKNYEYFHAVWMFQPILDDTFKSIDELPENEKEEVVLDWSEGHVHRLRYLTRLCFQKGWF